MTLTSPTTKPFRGNTDFVVCPENLWMAPMEGITDLPFRKIVKKHGCAITCVPMIHSEAVLRGNSKRLQQHLRIDPSELPVGFQLCGCDPDSMAEAAQKLEQLGCSFVDINMGCPENNILKLGAGAALMKDPKKIQTIVQKVRKSISIPLSTKIRLGWDEASKNFLEVGKLIESEGANLITLHSRTKTQKHRGKPDWTAIAQLKNRVQIPVVGNGGVFQFQEIQNMLESTQADGVMIGRGALGNPWIFEKKKPSLEEIQNTLLEHLDLHLSFYENPGLALTTFRKHMVWYTRGLSHAAEFRMKIFQEHIPQKAIQLLKDFFSQLLSSPNPERHWVHVG